MTEPPWDEIDELIRPLVRLLYQHGFKTTTSCQGGLHGPHATRLPIVAGPCTVHEFTIKRIAISKIMIEAGWTGFTIRHSDRFDYQRVRGWWGHHSTLNIEPWTLDGQPT